MKPLVSIVIPCHNYGRFLAISIESALGQTYRGIEVVVVDDGSDDDTLEVAGRYPVRLISQERTGVCGAVNRGVQVSHGERLVLLSADDALAHTYVEETLAALDARPDVHFAYTGAAHFDGRPWAYPIEDFDVETLAERNYIHASALMRRSSWEHVGGYRLDMTDLRCEDWDLWLSFVEAGMRGVLVRKPLLYYRQHTRTGRNTLRFSPRAVRREVTMTARLQDHHPIVFTPRRLLRRLSSLPVRLMTGKVSVRHALLLGAFYGVMLARVGLRRTRR